MGQVAFAHDGTHAAVQTGHQIMHGAASALDIDCDIQVGSNLLAEPQFPEKAAEVKVLNQEFGGHPGRRFGKEMEIAGNSGLLVGRLKRVDVEIAVLEGEYQAAEFKVRIARADVFGIQADVGVHLLENIEWQRIIAEQSAFQAAGRRA